MQERYYRDTHEPYNPKLRGTTWTRNLIVFMWTEVHALWKTRNEQVHNPDNTLQRQDLEQQVSELYNQEDQVLAEDRNIFSMSLQDRIRHQSQQ